MNAPIPSRHAPSPLVDDTWVAAADEISRNYGGKKVSVYLSNGVRLAGVITQVLERFFYLYKDGVSQMVFCHAVATIMPEDGEKNGNR